MSKGSLFMTWFLGFEHLCKGAPRRLSALFEEVSQARVISTTYCKLSLGLRWPMLRFGTTWSASEPKARRGTRSRSSAVTGSH